MVGDSGSRDREGSAEVPLWMPDLGLGIDIRGTWRLERRMEVLSDVQWVSLWEFVYPRDIVRAGITRLQQTQ